jgi:hypothetical protein
MRKEITACTPTMECDLVNVNFASTATGVSIKDNPDYCQSVLLRNSNMHGQCKPSANSLAESPYQKKNHELLSPYDNTMQGSKG